MALTQRHKWGENGDEEGSEEHVDITIEERQPPCARVPQAQHVGVAVMHLHMSMSGMFGSEGRADLGGMSRTGVHIGHMW